MNQLRIIPIDYDREQLISLVTAPLRYQSTVDSLLEFYQYIQKIWSRHAIKSLAQERGLNLRKSNDKVIFAQICAEIELDSFPELVYTQAQHIQAELETTKAELETAKETIKTQRKAIALLKAGKPLNGREKTPIFKVFNSPTTKDMLVSNYKKLRLGEHPDVSPFPPAVACDRYSFIEKAYVALLNNWEERYDPVLEIDPAELEKAMSAKLPFNPTSFIL